MLYDKVYEITKEGHAYKVVISKSTDIWIVQKVNIAEEKVEKTIDYWDLDSAFALARLWLEK